MWELAFFLKMGRPRSPKTFSGMFRAFLQAKGTALGTPDRVRARTPPSLLHHLGRSPCSGGNAFTTVRFISLGLFVALFSCPDERSRSSLATCMLLSLLLATIDPGLPPLSVIATGVVHLRGNPTSCQKTLSLCPKSILSSVRLDVYHTRFLPEDI